jgi:hypothetical protein
MLIPRWLIVFITVTMIASQFINTHITASVDLKTIQAANYENCLDNDFKHNDKCWEIIK